MRGEVLSVPQDSLSGDWSHQLLSKVGIALSCKRLRPNGPPSPHGLPRNGSSRKAATANGSSAPAPTRWRRPPVLLDFTTGTIGPTRHRRVARIVEAR